MDTRITIREVAGRNRRARFPAAPRVGVLRIASASDPVVLLGALIFYDGRVTASADAEER